MEIAFEGDAVFFDLVAEQSDDPCDRKELQRVAAKYRRLGRCARRLPDSGLTRAQRWRFRAEECRTLADEFRNAECRRYLRGLAATYDRLADLAENAEVPIAPAHAPVADG